MSIINIGQYVKRSFRTVNIPLGYSILELFVDKLNEFGINIDKVTEILDETIQITYKANDKENTVIVDYVNRLKRSINNNSYNEEKS